jgi:hypothetical protein
MREKCRLVLCKRYIQKITQRTQILPNKFRAKFRHVGLAESAWRCNINNVIHIINVIDNKEWFETPRKKFNVLTKSINCRCQAQGGCLRL